MDRLVPARSSEGSHTGTGGVLRPHPYRFKLRRLVSSAVLCIAASCALTGCTIFPEQKNPTLAQTTSAEQNERIFWQMVRKQQWAQLEPLLAANVVWTLPGKVLTREQIVPYLQGLYLGDSTITSVTVKPNGPDMTVAYTLQIQTAGAARSVAVVSVWQQVKSGYIMVLRSEHPLA